MKLIGNLKKTVDEIDSKEGKRDAIRKAGMMLTDDELEQVSGGNNNTGPNEPKVRRMIVGTDENGNPIYVDYFDPFGEP